MPLDVPSLQTRLAAAFAGQLDVGELLGAGGFAAVFRARDPVLERDVAIKVLEVGNTTPDAGEHFLAEARIVATVEHPHIVPLYAAEVRDGLLCLTMRLIPGDSLAARIARDGPLPPADAARIAHEVAQALAMAHDHGVVHRDIKPENILIDANGHAIVTDFGISLLTGRPSDRQAGMMIGTPQYVSPEQALGDAIDGKADVYSLGVVLYEMIAGRLPFEAKTTSALLAKQIIETPPPLAGIRPDTPTALVTATERALAKSPNQRPTAAELTGLLADALVPAALLSPRAVRRKRRWRRIRWTSAIVVAIVAALGFTGWSVYKTYTTFSGGRVPALSAVEANVPTGLVDAARASGSLHPGERILFAFIPGDGDWTTALLITDSAIIRRDPHGDRRHEEWRHGNSLSISVYDSHGVKGITMRDSTAGKAAPPVDTLYTNLSGAEVGIFLSAALDVMKKHDEPPPGTHPQVAAHDS